MSLLPQGAAGSERNLFENLKRTGRCCPGLLDVVSFKKVKRIVLVIYAWTCTCVWPWEWDQLLMQWEGGWGPSMACMT